MKSPIIQFDFLTDENRLLFFSQPEKVIVASNVTDIPNSLNEVERAIVDGYYVAGYISYEATYAFSTQLTENITTKMPLLWFGVFRKPSFQPLHKTGSYTVSDWEMMESKATYQKNFQLIKDAILKNKIEQVNYTVPFESYFTGNAFAYYTDLKSAQQAKYSAYIDNGNFQILSVSPELFFNVKNDIVTVKPMKGTIHRGKTFKEDMINKRWLQTSDKNMYENKLISDLMKNELKKVADASSIQVTSEYDIEKYPTVYQMTSTISGNVLPEINMTQILKALFPCGSITGVPKYDTMQMIANLEASPREVYCGAIGYFTPNREAIFNVPIRTVMIDKKEGIARYGAGGAITESSTFEEEYEEMLTKTKVLHLKKRPFQLLETFGLYDGKYVVYDEHLRRLEHSAAYFNFNINNVRIDKKLQEYARMYQDGAWRVRLVVSEAGEEHLEIFKLTTPTNNDVKLAATPIHKENILLYHKTTDRTLYKEKTHTNAFDTLLWNEQKEVTEFTIGNIVVELNGKLLTPPINSGLLPGTYREHLLNKGILTEQIIYKSDLENCTNIWLINSVRKWVKVNLLE